MNYLPRFLKDNRRTDDYDKLPPVAIYCKDEDACINLCEALKEFIIPTSLISQEVWDNFGINGIFILLCTDELMKNVNADFNELTFVINYDFPDDVETYDNRCKDLKPDWKGKYVSFVKLDEELEKLRAVCLAHNFAMDIPGVELVDNPLPVLGDEHFENSFPSGDVNQMNVNSSESFQESQPILPVNSVRPEIPADAIQRYFEADETIYEEDSIISTDTASSIGSQSLITAVEEEEAGGTSTESSSLGSAMEESASSSTDSDHAINDIGERSSGSSTETENHNEADVVAEEDAQNVLRRFLNDNTRELIIGCAVGTVLATAFLTFINSMP